MSKSFCLLCGMPLVSLLEPQPHTCELCRGLFESDTICKQGHYVCEVCHSAPEDELIEKVCLNSTSTQPVELAISLLKVLAVPMLGPVHQYLIPAVLLTAYYNQLGDPLQKKRKLQMARQRAGSIIGNFCGFYGVCVTGIGTGIFISLIADSSPASEGAWGLANQMTTESLRCIDALAGTRCCKRDTLVALQTTKKFVEKNFQVVLEVPERVTCEFSFYNQNCMKEECPFSPLEN